MEELVVADEVTVLGRLDLMMRWVERWRTYEVKRVPARLWGTTLETENGALEFPTVSAHYVCTASETDRPTYRLRVPGTVRVVLPLAGAWTSFTDVLFEAGDAPLDICQNAFSGCENLRTVTLPDNLASLGTLAEGTPSAREARYMANYTSFYADAGAFSGCAKLREVCVAPRLLPTLTGNFARSPAIVNLGGLVATTLAGDSYALADVFAPVWQAEPTSTPLEGALRHHSDLEDGGFSVVASRSGASIAATAELVASGAVSTLFIVFVDLSI